MSWANLDDRLHAHPKVRKLQRIPFAGPEAFGVWAWCLSWCRAYSADAGLIVVADVATDWNADPEHMALVFELLLSVGLVDAGDEGTYTIHDWADWQHSQQSRAGVARAAKAVRNELGRFASSSALEPLDKAGYPAGPRHSTPLHATPRAGAREADDESSDFRRRIAEATKR